MHSFFGSSTVAANDGLFCSGSAFSWVNGMLFVLAAAHESAKFALSRPGTVTLDAHAHAWCGRLVVQQGERVLATFDVHDAQVQARRFVFDVEAGEMVFRAEDRGDGRGEAWVKGIDIRWRKA